MIDLAAVERAVNRAAVRYDRSGDQHYDVTSAFIKSIRGSDVDAAVHYLARMLEAGEDPRFIARRLMIHASEDVGMADPTALPIAVAAAQVVQLVGLPEARIALAQATIHLATAPKSNAVITRDRRRDGRRPGGQGRIGAAAAARRALPGRGEARQRADATSTRTTGREPLCAQQYPPDELVGRDYYQPDRLRRRTGACRAGAEAAADHSRGSLTSDQTTATVEPRGCDDE